MFVFSQQDFDANGTVLQSAVARECESQNPSFPFTTDLVQELYSVAECKKEPQVSVHCSHESNVCLQLKPMFVFSLQDFDADGNVLQSSVERECALMKPSFPVTAELVQQLHLLAQHVPQQTHVEKQPAGKYIELQVGRSVENKLGFRFIS